MTTIKGVRERPILFSGPMVRAILDGKKTQTRRVFRLPEGWTHDEDDLERIHILLREGVLKWAHGTTDDRLWVRETWRVARINGASGGVSEFATVQFKEGFGILPYDAGWRERYARLIESEKGWERSATANLWGKWRPSIFMPRWACRILLDVVDVRIERLNDISEADAMAEGAEPLLVPPDGGGAPHVEGFRSLWDHINGKRAPWSSNPWVWVVTFKRVEEASHGDL